MGVALVALSKVPAVAVHANVGVTEPADAVAASEIGWSTVVSSGNTESELMFADTGVAALTTIVPASGVAPVQTSVRLTPVVAPGTTEKFAEPEHEIVPSTDVAVSVIV